MKIGLDIHGCIDKYPELFSKLSGECILKKGFEIHIITGQEWQNAKPIVERLDIRYTYHYSIVDHHRKIGTPMYKRTDKDGYWMDRELWVKSKGDYATSVGLDLHFDDSTEYGKYFPDNCTYVLVKEGFKEVIQLLKEEL